MESDCRHVVDVTSFLLFEATGDSESNSDSGNEISKADDDDAESCCQDQSSYHEDNNDDGFDQGYQTSQENESPEEVILGLESKVEQEQVRATADANGNGELLVLNEMEKNKLFWEKCLAS